MQLSLIIPRAATAAKDAKDWSLPSYGATLTLSQPGGQIMPTLQWGPWLAKICCGGPDSTLMISSGRGKMS